MSPVKKILSEALRLSLKERAAIARHLLSSLERGTRAPDLTVEKAWQDEIQKRWSDVRHGRAELTSWEDVASERGGAYR